MKKNKDTSSRKGGLDLVRVRRAGQITLSRKVREAMNLGEGDYLEPPVHGRRCLAAASECTLSGTVGGSGSGDFGCSDPGTPEVCQRAP